MAELTVKRVLVLAAIAGAVVGGAVAGGVADASSNETGGSGSSPGGSRSVSTVAVVRTNLQSTVQLGGSIGYQGSYAIVAPSGSNAEQVAQAQQEMAQATDTLAADRTADSDTATADDQGVTADQNAVTTASSTLTTDQAAESKACAGRGASTSECMQASQKVSQDQTQYNQSQQQLSAAQANATRDRDQSAAKLRADTTQMQAAQASVASVEADAVNPGTVYTSLPKVGKIIRQGEPVYSVSGLPVPLLYGPVAAYRAFELGMADGPDVLELNQDLIALGFGTASAATSHFSTATEDAVKKWQAALGVPATGTVRLGEVVFEPGPIRVTTVTPSIGQAVAPGNVLYATSTTPIVTVSLDVTQEYLLKPGDPVTVELPDGVTTVGGEVQTVGNVATCPGGGGQGSGNGTPGGANSADQTPCSSSGSGSSSTPAVTVTVTLNSTPSGATLDQAPVNVNITTERADNVLAVPVNALLALQGGGDGVEVVDGGVHRLVGVTTGLYSNTLVQVSGDGINAGTLVEVPTS